MKFTLFAFLSLSYPLLDLPASASSPRFSSVAVAPNGTVLKITRDQAISYCQHLGPAAALPSVLEIAEFAQQNGAHGVSQNAADEPIYVSNLDGTIDRFFYDPTGFRSPNAPFALNLYWTSGVKIGSPEEYVLVGKNGVIAAVSEIGNPKLPVICRL